MAAVAAIGKIAVMNGTRGSECFAHTNATRDISGVRSDRAVGGPFKKIRAPKENAMAEHATPATCGVDHVGLSVRDLESTRRFFCDCLGWRVVGERPEYPAAFVSDGRQIVTL